MEKLNARELYILYRGLRDLKTFEVATLSKISNVEVGKLMDKVNKELYKKH